MLHDLNASPDVSLEGLAAGPGDAHCTSPLYMCSLHLPPSLSGPCSSAPCLPFLVVTLGHSALICLPSRCCFSSPQPHPVLPRPRPTPVPVPPPAPAPEVHCESSCGQGICSSCRGGSVTQLVLCKQNVPGLALDRRCISASCWWPLLVALERRLINNWGPLVSRAGSWVRSMYSVL